MSIVGKKSEPNRKSINILAHPITIVPIIPETKFPNVEISNDFPHRWEVINLIIIISITMVAGIIYQKRIKLSPIRTPLQTKFNNTKFISYYQKHITSYDLSRLPTLIYWGGKAIDSELYRKYAPPPAPQKSIVSAWYPSGNFSIRIKERIAWSFNNAFLCS